MKYILLLIILNTFVSASASAKWQTNGYEEKHATTSDQIQELRAQFSERLGISRTEWYFLKDLNISLTTLKWDGAIDSYCPYGYLTDYVEITKYSYDVEGPFGHFHEEKWGNLVDPYDPICKGRDN